MSIPVVCQAVVSDPMACLLGIGTVFAGLICLIILCKIVGWICNAGKSVNNEVASNASPTPASSSTPAQIPNRRETVAAIAVAIAEETGEDVSAIRILSIEKI